MKPMKPNATWKRWNNIHFVESVECFLFVTICFFWSVPALIRSFGFHVIPWALAKLPLYNRYWRSALVPVASESKCMRQVVRKARNVSHWVLLLGLRYHYYYCHDSFLFLRKLLNLRVAVVPYWAFFWSRLLNLKNSEFFNRCITSPCRTNLSLRMGQRHRLQHRAHVPQHGAPLRAGEVSGRRRSGTRSGARASSHGYSGAGGKRTKRHSDLGGSLACHVCIVCLIKGRVFQNWMHLKLKERHFMLFFSLIIDESLRPLQGFSASPVDSYQHLCTRMLVWMHRHLLKYPYHLCRYLLHAQCGSKTNKGLRDAMVQHSTRGLGRAREVWECQFSEIRIEHLFT